MSEWRRTLIFHEKHVDDADMRINSKLFPELKPDDVIEIIPLERVLERSGSGDTSAVTLAIPRFFIKVEIVQPLKGTFQISLSSTMADMFHFRKTKQEVVVRLVAREQAALDMVEITFKEQYISRGDLWRMKGQLVNQYVYRTKICNLFGQKAQVDDMTASMRPVKCGIITNDTKIICRSRSARMFWLIQLSEEMWNFDDDGQLFFEKAVNSFLRTLLDKWKELQANHSVSIIFFARTYFSVADCTLEPAVLPGNIPAVSEFPVPSPTSTVGAESGVEVDPIFSFNVDSRNRLYQDFYKVVVDGEDRENWDGLIRQLKQEFMQFPLTLNWGTRDSRTGMIGQPSSSKDGNILEAINLAINVCDKHYMDRELSRVGLSIYILSAGTGVFEVSCDMSQLTKQRVIDNGVSSDMQGSWWLGIAVDLISVSTPPLHPTPVFIFRNPASDTKDSNEVIGSASALISLLSPIVGDTSQHHSSNVNLVAESYQNPHWMRVSYFGTHSLLRVKRVLCAEQSTLSYASALWTLPASEFRPLPAYRMLQMSVDELSQRMGVKHAINEDSDSELSQEDDENHVASGDVASDGISPLKVPLNHVIVAHEHHEHHHEHHHNTLQGSDDLTTRIMLPRVAEHRDSVSSAGGTQITSMRYRQRRTAPPPGWLAAMASSAALNQLNRRVLINPTHTGIITTLVPSGIGAATWTNTAIVTGSGLKAGPWAGITPTTEPDSVVDVASQNRFKIVRLSGIGAGLTYPPRLAPAAGLAATPPTATPNITTTPRVGVTPAAAASPAPRLQLRMAADSEIEATLPTEEHNSDTQSRGSETINFFATRRAKKYRPVGVRPPSGHHVCTAAEMEVYDAAIFVDKNNACGMTSAIWRSLFPNIGVGVVAPSPMSSPLNQSASMQGPLVVGGSAQDTDAGSGNRGLRRTISAATGASGTLGDAYATPRNTLPGIGPVSSLSGSGSSNALNRLPGTLNFAPPVLTISGLGTTRTAMPRIDSSVSRAGLPPSSPSRTLHTSAVPHTTAPGSPSRGVLPRVAVVAEVFTSSRTTVITPRGSPSLLSRRIMPPLPPPIDLPVSTTTTIPRLTKPTKPAPMPNTTVTRSIETVTASASATLSSVPSLIIDPSTTRSAHSHSISIHAPVRTARGEDVASAAAARKKQLEQAMNTRIANRRTINYIRCQPGDALPDSPFVLIEAVRIDDVMWMSEALRRSGLRLQTTISTTFPPLITTPSTATIINSPRHVTAQHIHHTSFALPTPVATATPTAIVPASVLSGQLDSATIASLALWFSSYSPFQAHQYDQPRHSYNRSRWLQVTTSYDQSVVDPLAINWKSLTKPAILPLTIDYFPSMVELNSASQFVQYPSSLALSQNENDFQNRPDLLLQACSDSSELVAQRLAQDFQLTTVALAVSHSSGAGVGAVGQQQNQNQSQNNQIAVAESGELEGVKKVYHLAIDGQFHQLAVDAETGNVEIKKWVSKEKVVGLLASDLGYPYRYFLWSPCTFSFRRLEIVVAVTHDEYRWNYLDQLISGFHNDFPDALKYRRLRFAIIPFVEPVAGTSTNANATPMCIISPPVNIGNAIGLPTSSVPHSSSRRALLAKASSNKTASVGVIVHLNSTSPVLPTNLGLGRVTNANVLTVPEILVVPSLWSASPITSAKPDIPNSGDTSAFPTFIRTFETATADQTNPVLMSSISSSPAPAATNQISVPASSLPVKDLTAEAGKSSAVVEADNMRRMVRVETFRKFVEQVTARSAASLDIKVSDASVTQLLNMQSTLKTYVEEQMFAPGFGLTGVDVNRIRIGLKSTMPDRCEWFLLQFDTSFHPDTCFHFELHWLAASGAQIDEWLQTLRRRARASGLRVCQIPVQQPMRLFDPFHGPLSIAVSDRQVLETIQRELLSTFGFIFDGVPRSFRKQFIHTTGMAIVRVVGNGLLFTGNHLRSASEYREDNVILFTRLQRRVEELVKQSQPIV